MVTLEQFKLYARADSDAEDATMTVMLTAAQKAVADMTGKGDPGTADELYDMAVMQLAAHWHENRTPTETGATVSAVPFTLQLLLNHITMCSRYKEVQPDGVNQ